MTRQAVRMLGVTMCAAAILAVSTKANAQAPKPPVTGLEAVVGVYQGTVDARRGKAPIACELRLANGKVTGTLQPGDDALAVTGASLDGNTLTLNLDINGNDVPVTGTFNDGHFEGSVMGATLVMTKVDPHAAAVVSAPPPNTSEADKAAVKQAAYDYAESGFEGAADRVGNASPRGVRLGVTNVLLLTAAWRSASRSTSGRTAPALSGGGSTVSMLSRQPR